MCGLKILILVCSGYVFEFLHEFFISFASPLHMFNSALASVYLCFDSKNHSGDWEPSDPAGSLTVTFLSCLMKAYLASFISHHVSTCSNQTQELGDLATSHVHIFSITLQCLFSLLGMPFPLTVPDTYSSFMPSLSIISRCLIWVLPLIPSNLIRRLWPLLPRHCTHQYSTQPCSHCLACVATSTSWLYHSVTVLLISVSLVLIVLGTGRYPLRFAVKSEQMNVVNS